MLNSEGASLDHPKGLNNRFVYFCCRNFFIRGQNELRETCAHQFELHVTESNEEFLRYNGSFILLCFFSMIVCFACFSLFLSSFCFCIRVSFLMFLVFFANVFL
jgi:hypothetical protein